MNQKKLREFLDFALENRKLFIWPVVCCTTLALGYAIFKPSRWDATQALFVRDESAGSLSRGGKFESVDAMQTAQETILEVAKHPQVLKAALLEVGPPRKTRRAWPSDRAVDDFRKKVSISAPYGAQFGRTEMLYVSVEDRSVERATELTAAVVTHLIERMKTLRLQRYESIVTELEQAVTVGKTQLEESTRELQKMEQEVGMDLAELRVLMDQGQGDGNVRRALSQIEAELRGATVNLKNKQNAVEQLTLAIDDPRRLINMPNTVLDNQPALKKLKEGLVSAQLRVSELMGVKSPRHPDVQAAIKAEERIRQQLYRQLRISIATLSNEVTLAQERVNLLQKQQDMVGGRLGGLATIRTRYSNLATEVRQRSEYVEQAAANLSAARANLLSAQAISLIQTVEKPVPGIRPLGLGRKNIVLGGLCGGVLIGLGVLFLAMPVEIEGGLPGRSNGTERRIGNWGRRATDRLWNAFGRRFADYPQRSITAERRVPRQGPVTPPMADGTTGAGKKAASPTPPRNPSPKPLPPLQAPLNTDVPFSAGKN